MIHYDKVITLVNSKILYFLNKKIDTYRNDGGEGLLDGGDLL